MTTLQVSGLKKGFGSLMAVDGVSFEVAQGSCFGLLGPNGAGKTTTISMIVGVLKPDSGHVSLEGEPVGPDSAGVKAKIGYVTQELALYEELSALDNLKVFGALYGLGGDALKSASDRALDTVGLKDRATDRVHKYSGGMKRRLNIALALLHDPSLIILDEPTVGVDPQSRNAIFDTLQNLQQRGKTLLYTTHYMEEVERLCDTIAVMDHGKVIALGSLRELQSKGVGSNLVTIESPGIGEQTVAALKALPGLHSVLYSDPVLTLGVDDFTHGLNSALATLSASNANVTSVQSSRPSLESLFLELTGRSLRD